MTCEWVQKVSCTNDSVSFADKEPRTTREKAGILARQTTGCLPYTDGMGMGEYKNERHNENLQI